MPTDVIRRNLESDQFVWDSNTMSWVKMTQPLINAGSVTISGSIAVSNFPATQPVSATNLDVRDLVFATDKVDVSGSSSVGVTGTLSAVTSITNPIAVTPTPLSRASGTASSSGNNTAITPTSGKALRIYYLSYNPSAALTCYFRFGAAGAAFLQNTLTQAGAVIAKDFGDFRYVQGAIDEALVLNLSGASSTVWNAFYVEV